MSMYVRRIGLTNQAGDASDVRFGSLADMAEFNRNVGFVPIADLRSAGRNAAISPASPLVRDRGRSGRGLQSLERSVRAATLAE